MSRSGISASRLLHQSQPLHTMKYQLTLVPVSYTHLIPDALVTTNLMGTFKGLDYFKWAKEMDIVSWDNYPAYDLSLIHILHASFD